MKLDLCLLSCDLNPDYYPFFPFVRKLWKEIVGIDCILILVANELPYSLLSEKEHIIMFPPLPNIPTGFQAQCIRVLYPCLLDKQGIIISDMDIVPLDRDFFLQVETYNDDAFVIYRDVISEYLQYPICYCAASSETWRNIFSITIMNDLRLILESWYSKDDYKISSATSEMWAQDQLKLFEAVNTYEMTSLLSDVLQDKKNKKVIHLFDEDTKFTRLDRSNLDYISNHIDDVKRDIVNQKYSDFHLPRPYEQHKNLLKSLFHFR